MFQPSPHKKFVFALLGILAFVFLIYSPVLKSDFLNWDDDVHVLANPFLRPLSGPTIADIMTTMVCRVYVPLTILTFAVEKQFFGLNPFVYHLDNLLLHLAVTALSAVLARRLGFSRRASLFAALLFGIHPIHVESVAWVTERKDVLYAFFYVGALILYLRYLALDNETRLKSGEKKQPADGNAPTIARAQNFSDSSPARHAATSRIPAVRSAQGWEQQKFFVAAFLCGILSVLAKPMALSLPVMFLILDWYQRRKFSRHVFLEKIAFALPLLPIIWMSYAGHARHIVMDFSRAVLIWGWCFIFYLRKFFMPDQFMLFYRLPAPLTLTHPDYLATVIIFLLVAGSLILFRRNRLVVFAFLWYVASVFFLLRLDYQADLDMVADRFMYLACLGFCLLLGNWGDKIFAFRRTRSWQRVVGFAAILLMSSLAFKTYAQTFVWKDSRSFWSYQMRQHAASPDLFLRALLNVKMGEALLQESGFQKRAQEYQLCWQNAGGVPVNCRNPVLSEQSGELLPYFQKAISLSPSAVNAYYQAGKLYWFMGKPDDAGGLVEKALKLSPDHFDAYFLQAEIWHEQGKYAQATRAFRQAMATSPDKAGMRKRVLDFYQEAKAKPEAAAFYNQEWQVLQAGQGR